MRKVTLFGKSGVEDGIFESMPARFRSVCTSNVVFKFEPRDFESRQTTSSRVAKPKKISSRHVGPAALRSVERRKLGAERVSPFVPSRERVHGLD